MSSLSSRSQQSWYRAGSSSVIGSILIFVLVITLGIMWSAWEVVDPGHVGIVFSRSSRTLKEAGMQPGWYLRNPFTDRFMQYPVRTQTYTMVRTIEEGQVSSDDSVKVGSREGQSMWADVSITWSIDPNEVANLYTTWAGSGIDVIQAQVVREFSRSAMNDVASQYGWEDIYGERRVEYTQKVAEDLKRRFAEKHVRFESINLRGWYLPEALQTALNTKITAQQQARQQEYQLEQARIIAQQDKVEAEGKADALRAQAQGEADATRIRADAQASANERLQKSLSNEVITWEQIKKWDGKMPLVNGSDGQQILDLSNLAGSQPQPVATVSP